MAIYYLGAFPIEGGGVTNKNRDLFDALSAEGIAVKKVDLNLLKRKKSIFEVVKFCRAIFPGNQYIIGVSGARGTSINLVRFLDRVSPWNLKRSIYFMMGGTESFKIARDAELIKLYSTLKRIYVETSSMKRVLEEAGITSVEVFPNCRPKPYETRADVVEHNESLKCVYCSYIEQIKVDSILEVAKMVSSVQFDFYGDISAEYKKNFLTAIGNMANCHYYGCSGSSASDLHTILVNHDILIFPPESDHEGAQDILLESMKVGILTIKSRTSHSIEKDNNMINGEFYADNTPEDLQRTINTILANPENLLRIKNAHKYFVEKQYIKENGNDNRCSKECKLKCLFLSNVQPEKGVDWIIEAASALQTLIDLDIYGVIPDNYKVEFFGLIKNLNNVRYKGIYTGSTLELYKLLSSYDLILLPTRWENEGVPGVLIEAKMAGVPVIVTDHRYNKEIVDCYLDGIVLDNNTVDMLIESIKICACDRNLLNGLKYGCKYHRSEYIIDTYLNDIISCLRC